MCSSDHLLDTIRKEWSLYSGNDTSYYTDKFIIEHLIQTVIKYCKQSDVIQTMKRCIIESKFNLLGGWTNDKDANYITETLMTCLATTEVKYFEEQLKKEVD